METNNLYLSELQAELAELREELKIISKHLHNKKKMSNDFFKDLMFEKDEVEKLISELEIEIEIATNSLKQSNTDGNSDNTIN